MPSVSLTNLITRVRSRTDTTNAASPSDTEITAFLNSSIGALRDILIKADEDFDVTSQDYTATGSESGLFDLPSDFYQERGVDYVVDSSTSLTLLPFSFADRNKHKNLYPSQSSSKFSYKYKLTGTQLHIIPEPASGVNFKLWYIPVNTELSDGTDTFNFYNAWDEFVVIDSSIKVNITLQEAVDIFLVEKQMLEQRILNAAQSRRRDLPETVRDVEALNDDEEDFFGW